MSEKKTMVRVFLPILTGIAILGSIFLGIYDLRISESFVSMTASSPFLSAYANFFDRTLFDGDRFGGQDFSYILILLSLGVYLVSYIPKMQDKLISSRKYSGFMLAVILVLAIINRGFKVLFARARPGVVADDPSMYSHMWIFGKLSFTEALSHGSFTSGHTNVAIFLVVIAFISLGTKRKGIIVPVFILTIGYAILMALGRVFEGDHFLSDGFWSIIIGILIAAWIYYGVLNIPEQEADNVPTYAKFEEFQWGILFAICFTALIAGLISIRYMFLHFLWYQPIILICSPMMAIFAWKRMKKILYIK
ncbi:hypothetical protein NEF87_002866 [Candidatus Lokiarchaeum ossiferum]|uniref:Phosphatidic acid phosphatase type 2/haloperoxidase domain-containing protein n=1 Tax=Candidatus Lokiarchaeum ossiferum TaxID=2951803 RepID=A0ABY6HT44_9ARCH|nr:hypothetical protein NEF87_002866 [Candidatus Lokiarchaeum sp. B-35]